MDKRNNSEEKNLSRRKFLTGTSAVAVGALATGGILGLVKPGLAAGAPVTVMVNGKKITGSVLPRIEKNTTLVPAREVAEGLGAKISWDGTNKTVNISGQAQGGPAAAKWPYPYIKLDPEVIRKKAHLGYYDGACCYGAFSAIIGELSEKIGSPFTQIPSDMMRYGEGGVAGWASLCGAINGACAAINLVAGEDNYKELVSELMSYYCETPLPTDTSNKYAVEHAFLVDTYKTDAELGKSVSGSPLCHASVTNWCQATGFASGSSERSERCGRLTGDLAAHAVKLLNDLYDKKFVPAFTLPASVQECRSCHSKGKDYQKGQFTRGKMDCVQCHNPH